MSILHIDDPTFEDTDSQTYARPEKADIEQLSYNRISESGNDEVEESVFVPDLDSEPLSKDSIRSYVARFFEEAEFDPDEYDMPSFNEFYGFKSPFPILRAYNECASDFRHLIELLKHGCKDELPEGFREMDVLRLLGQQIVSLDIGNQSNAETINLFALLPEERTEAFIPEESHCAGCHEPIPSNRETILTNTQRIEIVADVYASYDQLRRLVAFGSLMFDENHQACTNTEMTDTLWEEFDKRNADLYQADRARITYDKSNKLEKELRRLKAYDAENNLAIEQSYVEQVLSTSKIDKGNNQD